jgi:hypothetical protein
MSNVVNRGTYDDEEDEEDDESDIDDIEEGDEEDENESGEGESGGENSSPTDPILRKPSSGQMGLQPGIAFVIVPRRLSTISSRDTLSVRSREENDHLNDFGSSSFNSKSNFNPSSSPGTSAASHYNPSNSTAL